MTMICGVQVQGESKTYKPRSLQIFEMILRLQGSLYEGVGRKLRGLDAVRFRQSVMRQTGFLESTAEQSYC